MLLLLRLATTHHSFTRLPQYGSSLSLGAMAMQNPLVIAPDHFQAPHLKDTLGEAITSMYVHQSERENTPLGLTRSIRFVNIVMYTPS